MVETSELKRIKKIYGENFMKLCRELFPTLLEYDGILLKTLFKYFPRIDKTLYEDITKSKLVHDFKSFIFERVNIEIKKQQMINKVLSPFEIFDECGYYLYECHTESEIQSFRKYYKFEEELCSFNRNRLDGFFVFFAVRKDVDTIRREDFTEPRREDKYGTSVMSIQFNKEGTCTVSIKNRYNHTVNNPDATYGNDLDRISPGLTRKFSNFTTRTRINFNS